MCSFLWQQALQKLLFHLKATMLKQIKVEKHRLIHVILIRSLTNYSWNKLIRLPLYQIIWITIHKLVAPVKIIFHLFSIIACPYKTTILQAIYTDGSITCSQQ